MKTKIVTILVLLLPAVVILGIFWPKAGEQNQDGQDQEELAEGLPVQENSEGNVTVEVTPTIGASSFDFEIVLDTHSVELGADMLEISELKTDQDESYSPAAWEGSASGGHHRSGVLKFNVPSPRPEEIELIIVGIGGVDRRFRWKL